MVAPDGLASGSVAIKRISDSPYQVDYFPTALTNVARQTKHLDPSWVKNGCDIADNYVRYAKGLVGPLPIPGKLY